MAPSPRRLIIQFCLLFFVFILLFTFLLSTDLANRYLHEPLARLIANSSLPFLAVFGRASVSGNILNFNGFGAAIVEACNGILPTYIYLSAVFAFPSRWRAKGWGVVIGIPLIFLINLIRVITLMMFGAFQPELFEQVHIYVWQALVIALSMGIWIFWAERFVRPDSLGSR